MILNTLMFLSLQKAGSKGMALTGEVKGIRRGEVRGVVYETCIKYEGRVADMRVDLCLTVYHRI